ncbi:MAG: DUF5081 family protein [Thomasclavelia sp.]|uniref:DUF5081 family protein n=1 Tax=Thomasclavelia sp. TaxID=3025757 RepID=UPI0039A043C5
MIILDSEELIALNSVIDNIPIYGLQLNDTDLNEEKRVIKTINSLKDKEIMFDGSFTDKGLAVLRLLELYKKNTIHIFINRLRIAPLDNEQLIIIELKENNQFLISKTQKVTLEKKLILAIPYLQLPAKKRFIPFTISDMSKKDIENELNDQKWRDILLIQKHEENRTVLNKLYYMTENIGYCYDYILEARVQKESFEIRIDLMDILEIGGGE